MQKLELRNNLNEIVNNLKSKEIIDYFNNPNLQKNQVLQLIIESKGGFDKAISDKDKEKVFKVFETDKMYELNYFSSIISFVSQINVNNPTNGTTSRTNFFSNDAFSTFISFHRSLLSTFRLIDTLLIENRELFNSSNSFDALLAEQNGNLIFQIIDNENLALSKLETIISRLKKLIETVYYLYDKVENEKFEDFPKISMIDSGSDINIVIKIPEKASILISQIVKQFWEYITANKSYKYRQKLVDVEKSISVLEKIKEAVDKNVIDLETAQVIRKGILDNVEDIIITNTLTKQIVLETKEVSNRQLLLQQNKMLLLENENKIDNGNEPYSISS